VPAREATISPDRGHVPSPAIVELRSITEPLDLEKIFGRRAPLHVDLGCGDGAFLCALAQRMPERDFLGIERLLGRINSTAHKIDKCKIDNAHVLRIETSYAVRYLLPAESVETFYLLFPDPWPKRRHQRRRIVSEEFLQALNVALIPGGIFHVATDQLDYFQQIKAIADTRFTIVDLANTSPARTDLPATQFEKRFREQGAPIYRLVLRKVSPVE
jgi:tRNA (guanine-N7-)-methyltransferase